MPLSFVHRTSILGIVNKFIGALAMTKSIDKRAIVVTASQTHSIAIARVINMVNFPVIEFAVVDPEDFSSDLLCRWLLKESYIALIKLVILEKAGETLNAVTSIPAHRALAIS